MFICLAACREARGFSKGNVAQLGRAAHFSSGFDARRRFDSCHFHYCQTERRCNLLGELWPGLDLFFDLLD